MDEMALRERDISVDLESGRTSSEEDAIRGNVLGVIKPKKSLGRVWSGFVSFDGSVKGEEGISPGKCTPDSEDVSSVSVDVFTDSKSGQDETVALVEKRTSKEKRKKNSRKPPKPPRPPRGPSLDAADQKLIREISELAMLKRARNERTKALKKMKAAKASSSNGNLFAMIITVAFCLVIIFQGICSRSSSTLNFQGSPESAVATKGSLISVQYYKNPSVNDTSAPSSVSARHVDRKNNMHSSYENWSHFSKTTLLHPMFCSFVEQVSGSSPLEEVSRVAG